MNNSSIIVSNKPIRSRTLLSDKVIKLGTKLTAYGITSIVIDINEEGINTLYEDGGTSFISWKTLEYRVKTLDTAIHSSCFD